MKKIAIIENNIIATNTIRRKLCEVLIGEGYDVTILTTGTAESLDVARRAGFKVIDITGSTQHPAEILRYLRNLDASLKKLKPDVVLTFTIRPAIWGNLITRKQRLPTITNITGIGPLFERNNIAYRAARSLYKFVLKKTAHVFFQNEDDKKIFVEKKFVSESRSERIPGSGVDLDHYTPIALSPNENFTFLFISRLVKDKGIIEYVEAARSIRSKYPDAVFQVIGPVWNQNLKDNTVSEEEIESWEHEETIHYLGEQKDVRPFIAAADCIVLPSYREGTSNVLLEAAAMERPAITCDTTGCREIVDDGETGFLCRVRDSADLAKKMEQMYLTPLHKRNEMGKKARRKVALEYDKKIVTEAYLRAIKKVSA